MSRGCATRQSSSYVSGAHHKRIAQVQVVNVGRVRASDWSGSAATGREPPMNLLRASNFGPECPALTRRLPVF